MFNNLIELITSMPTEKDCREYFAKQRWEDGKPVCVHCGSHKVYAIAQGKRYECGEKDCLKRFSVTCGTIFHNSKIGLVKWFTAVYLCINNKKGISSHQLARQIGVTQKTAWFMLHRIRLIPQEQDSNTMLSNTVELDESFVGGIVSNMNKTRRSKLRTDKGTLPNKTMVVGMVERGGSLKLFAGGMSNNAGIVLPLVYKNISPDANVITDEALTYTGLSKQFAGHQTINHNTEEYVRDNIHTNTIEGVFSILKRTIIGTHHYLSAKHLDKYCKEISYRYNTRTMKDADRFKLSLQKVEARITYKELIATPEHKQVEISEQLIKRSNARRSRAIYQMKDGIILQEFPSIMAASVALGIHRAGIFRVLNGTVKTTAGYEWQYA